MSIYELISLFGIIVALAAIHSASVAPVDARSATLGVSNGLVVAAGIVLGDLFFVALTIFGLSMISEIVSSLFIVLKVLGGLYLLWFGFSLLSTREMEKIIIKKTNRKHSLVDTFVAGFSLTLGDIKAIVFYASLLPVFVVQSAIQLPKIVVVALVTLFSVGGVKAVYAVFANKVAVYAKRTYIESATIKVSGGLMIGVGGCLIVKA